MPDESGIYWQIAWETFFYLFLPLLVVSALVSTILSLHSFLKAFQGGEQRDSVFSRLSFIFSFCVVGFVIGIIIRLLGGFSLGTSADSEPDAFQFIATLASSFAAIAGLFFGETRVEGSIGVRPIGTASAIFMMIYGYFYISLVLAAGTI